MSATDIATSISQAFDELPAVIPLPKIERPHASAKCPHSKVKSPADLPGRLFLGSLDTQSFRMTAEGWKATYLDHGGETRLELSFEKGTRISVRRIKQAPSERVRLERKLLHDWLLIVANSGMRPTEAKNLRWKDVEFMETDDGSYVVRLWVQGKGKRRDLIVQPNARIYLERLKERTNPKSDEDYVFRSVDGERIESFKKGFDALCKDAGILHDRYGDKRAPYSLRHTYATFALLYGRVSVYTLAINMGTSVDMIEKHYGHVKPLQAHKELTARYKI